MPKAFSFTFMVGTIASFGAIMYTCLVVPSAIEAKPGVESLLFFDGVCNLCDGFVGFVADHDSGKRDGAIYTRSDALRVLALLGARRYVAAFHLLPAPLRDAGYKLVAKYRYKMFGQVESCREPPKFQSRFSAASRGRRPADPEPPGERPKAVEDYYRGSHPQKGTAMAQAATVTIITDRVKRVVPGAAPQPTPGIRISVDGPNTTVGDLLKRCEKRRASTALAANAGKAKAKPPPQPMPTLPPNAFRPSPSSRRGRDGPSSFHKRDKWNGGGDDDSD
ncbi:DUF393-containing protein [Aureococcus anophagefferens]|nr:DUF393-containing protein [Aureococcus anophagefferens]